MRNRLTRAKFKVRFRDAFVLIGLSTTLLLGTTLVGTSAFAQNAKRKSLLQLPLPTGSPSTSPSPTATPTSTPSPSPTPTATPTPTPSPSPSPGTEYSPHKAMTWTQTIPLVAAFKASKGEKVIFNTVFDDIDGKRPKGSTVPFTDFAGPGPYETVFTCGADAEFDSAGSGLTTKTVSGKASGNVYLFIKNTWTGATPITVTATGKDKDPRTAANPYPNPDSGHTRDGDITYTWTISKRTKCPLTLTNVAHAGCQMHGGWVAAPALYAYLAGPDAPPAYNGESILETFGPNTAGGFFTMADLTDAWKTANPTILTPDAAAAAIFPASNNGTFVLNAQNKMFDQHSGFGPTTAFKPASLVAGIGYTKQQSYSCEHNLGSYAIDRKYSTGGGITINKH